MCNSRNSTRTPFQKGRETEWKKVDRCLSNLLCFINGNTSFRTLGSCCGHGKYDMSIVCRTPFGFNIDICSGEIIPRKKRFYVKDEEGYYYIPETQKKKHSRNRCEVCGMKYETYPIILDDNPLSVAAFLEEEIHDDGSRRYICKKCRKRLDKQQREKENKEQT